MRNKIVALLLAVSMVTTVGGCGKEEADENPMATEEPVETPTESVEIAEPVEEIEDVHVDEPTDDTEGELSVGTMTTAELDFDAFEADEAKDHQFGDIGYVATYRDARETTGLNSTSTDDVWEYLTDSGNIDKDKDVDMWQVGINSYTGRWAYPTITDSDVTSDYYLYDWTDMFASYVTDEDEGNNAILICTGYDIFDTYTSPDSDAEYTFEEFGYVSVGDDKVEVYSVQSDEKLITYIYKLGGFTVVVEFAGDDVADSEKLLTKTMQNIIL